jgi:predicted dehydrogenase
MMGKHCKVCIVGMGSMGLRHAENLTKYFHENDIDGVIDAFSSGKGTSSQACRFAAINHKYTVFEEVPSDYDIIFIANPTMLHYPALELFKDHGKHFFVEKPLFDISQVNQSIPEFTSGQQVYVACPLRYTKVLKYVKGNIDLQDIIHVRAICSSYLPDWRPMVDYRKTYSARRSLGGGVKIDLIHEWDYLSFLFGSPSELQMISGKVSSLEIDSDDIALYIGKYKNKTLELHIDYFGRNAIRAFEMYSNDETVTVDIANNRICSSNLGVMEFSGERNDMYYSEIEHFFDVISGKSENTNDIQTAIRTLKLTEGIIE